MSEALTDATPVSRGNLDSVRAIARIRPERTLDELFDDQPGVLVLLSAPGGYGKTTFLEQWLSRRAPSEPVGQVMWLGVDAFTFDSNILEATAGPQLPEATSAGGPVTVVVDDAHTVTDPLALDAFHRFLRHRPPNVNVVVAAHYDPPLIWQYLIGDGVGARIGREDLVLTTAEVDRILRQHGLTPTTDQVGRVRELTGGWAILVRMAAVFLAPRTDVELGLLELAGCPKLISDFLRRELVEVMTPRVRRLVMRLSSVVVFDADLARAIDGADADAYIPEIVGLGVVVAVPSDSHDAIRYRFVPLIATYLRGELQRTDPELGRTLQVRAVRWASAHRRPAEAIDYAAHLGEAELLRQTIFHSGVELILQGRRDQALAVLDGCGTALGEDPIAVVLRALAAMEHGDHRYAASYLDCVVLADADLPSDGGSLLYRTLLLDVALERGEPDLIDLAEAVASSVGDRGWAVDAYAHTVLGAVYTRVGRSADGELSSIRAIALAKSAGLNRLVVRALSNRASVAGARGLPVLMEDRARYALATVRDASVADPLVAASPYVPRLHVAEAYGRFMQGKPLDVLAAEQARDVTEGGEVFSALGHHVPIAQNILKFDGSTNRLVLTAAAYSEASASLVSTPTAFPILFLLPRVAHMCMSVKRFDWARDLARKAERVFGCSDEVRLIDAAIDVEEGHPQLARKLLSPLLESVEAQPQTKAAAWALEAHACELAGMSGQSYAAMTRALETAAAHGVMRPLVEGGAGVAKIITTYRGSFGSVNAYADAVLAVMSRGTVRDYPPLTRAETHVLRFLATDRTTEEIAGLMHLSVNTVKTHLRGIYRKFDVRHRRDAVSVGQRLGLL
jgi:LuxR family transcriptional regulator, maltose regulon positive regulatory protein